MAKAPDHYEQSAHDPLTSPKRWFTVTPHDTDLLAHKPLYLRVNGAGAIRIVNDAGDDVTLDAAAGERFDCRPDKVMATGTTATGIVAFY